MRYRARWWDNLQYQGLNAECLFWSPLSGNRESHGYIHVTGRKPNSFSTAMAGITRRQHCIRTLFPCFPFPSQGSERCLLSDLRGDGRDCPACCLQLFPSSQTSSHYFPSAGKPASKALGIWQYSAEGWLSHKSIQIQCLAGVSPSRHCLSFCTLQQAAGDNCHPRTFLPVPFLLLGPGKN